MSLPPSHLLQRKFDKMVDNGWIKNLLTSESYIASGDLRVAIDTSQVRRMIPLKGIMRRTWLVMPPLLHVLGPPSLQCEPSGAGNSFFFHSNILFSGCLTAVCSQTSGALGCVLFLRMCLLLRRVCCANEQDLPFAETEFVLPSAVLASERCFASLRRSPSMY